MAFGSGTFNSVGSAVQDIFSSQATASGLRLKAHGDLAEAENYDLASTLATQNARFTETSTAVKQTQADRSLYKKLGTETAGLAAAGFTNSGTALDLMRESASQGALHHAVLGEQGLITEVGYNEQAKSFTNMSASARYAASVENEMADTAESNGKTMAGIHAASAIASIFTGGVGALAGDVFSPEEPKNPGDPLRINRYAPPAPAPRGLGGIY
jgi:hypothetical protein